MLPYQMMVKLSEFNDSSSCSYVLISVTFSEPIILVSVPHETLTVMLLGPKNMVGKLLPGWWLCTSIDNAFGLDAVTRVDYGAWASSIGLVTLFGVAFICLGLALGAFAVRARPHLLPPPRSRPDDHERFVPLTGSRWNETLVMTRWTGPSLIRGHGLRISQVERCGWMGARYLEIFKKSSILLFILYLENKERVLANMEAILQTNNLCKDFKKQRAVNNVSITVRRGSIYGLLGPNGAGKSTTLKMITGMLRPTSGKILFDGHEWSRRDLEQIGALIETPPLYENLSATENLEVRVKLLDIPKTRIGEVLRIVDLQDAGRKRAGQFSMGMKQRLGIAIALLNSPELLILDEPTNGLDPIGIQELRSLIRSFSSKGITVILSSHILSEVQLIADDIGIISNGVLGYEGPMNKDQNLEELFVEVVRKSQEER